jgi:large subunit GTPase 1
MPRNLGTSRKGKPKKHERAAGMGRALQKSQTQKHTPSASTGGMAKRQGVESINVTARDSAAHVDARASVLDVNTLDDFLIQAEMANREFLSEKEQLVVLDETAQASANGDGIILRGSSRAATKFAFKELSVPRRPAWDETTTAAELDMREKESFLEWRRAIAIREEEIVLQQSHSSLGVTPFEKNIEIWRQLWRVMERCSCIVQIVDARNPLFYLSQDLKAYATKELKKPMLLLINKSDYLSPVQRQAWHEYFSDPEHTWDHVFFSAFEEQQHLDAEAYEAAREEERMEQQFDGVHLSEGKDNNEIEDDEDEDYDDKVDKDDVVDTEEEGHVGKTESHKETTQSYPPTYSDRVNVGVEAPLSREGLLSWLHSYAKSNDCPQDPKYDRIPFGMVGFPNVGKSSVINVLMGNARNSHGVVRVGVASQPGKTKHFQTLLLPDREDMLLCDCPGLVFPSFVNNTADLIAAGVYPIAQMRDPWPVVDLLCQRVPRQVLNAQYSIQIPLPTPDAMLAAAKRDKLYTESGRIPPPTADDFLNAYCVARNLFATASGVPDIQRASRIIIKEYADGKLLYCHAPPHVDEEAFQRETLLIALQKTKKLREKVVVQPGTAESTTNSRSSKKLDAGDVGDDEDDHSDDGSNEPGVEDDDMLLEMMEDAELNGSKNPTATRMKKWGKKGRKLRNKDPYGCHSAPDLMLPNSTPPVGVSVNGGKYGRKGYTRPDSYGTVRTVT